MNDYKAFAYLYDGLTLDVDYHKLADYINKIFVKFSKNPKLVLDLGCGTGSLSVIMSEQGREVIGLDNSVECLSVAREKAEKSGQNILFINQDMADFELYGTVDAIVSTMDCVNHLLYKNDVKRLLRLAYNYLNPGGIFVFDINSFYKIENILANNVFCQETDNVFYTWENFYDKKSKICDFYLTFFVKDGEKYTKLTETHSERAYKTEEIITMATDAGFKVSGVFGEFGFKKPKNKEERIFFVLQKNA